jgi:hypothetical protein
MDGHKPTNNNQYPQLVALAQMSWYQTAIFKFQSLHGSISEISRKIYGNVDIL